MSAIPRLLPLPPFGLDKGLDLLALAWGPSPQAHHCQCRLYYQFEMKNWWSFSVVVSGLELELWQQTLTVQLPELRWRMEYLDFVPPFCYIFPLSKIIIFIWRQDSHDSQSIKARSSRWSSRAYQSSQEIRRVRRRVLIRPVSTYSRPE